jgi:hypothetical protein
LNQTTCIVSILQDKGGRMQHSGCIYHTKYSEYLFLIFYSLLLAV